MRGNLAKLNEWSFESVPYPGQPEEVILALAAVDGDVIAGTNEGRVIRETGDGWDTIGQAPAGIRSLCAI